ncbi:MAG: AAA family ATPase [Thermoplasmata archaeon]
MNRRPVALTGVPGTGKSAVAARLPAELRAVEVADLAIARGAGRRRSGGVVVDMDRLARSLARRPEPGVAVYVGHLAHLLPVRRAIVLRCDPRELARRLAARGDPPAERRENLLCEAIDRIGAEAADRGRPVLEIDTTGRPIGAVARRVAMALRRPGRGKSRPIDWLGTPEVTAHLLDWSR